MATERAIDKLKKAFSVDNKSSYEIYKNGQVILNTTTALDTLQSKASAILTKVDEIIPKYKEAEPPYKKCP